LNRLDFFVAIPSFASKFWFLQFAKLTIKNTDLSFLQVCLLHISRYHVVYTAQTVAKCE
jgi:hypothetical protein